MKLWQGWHNTDLGRSYFHYGPLGGGGGGYKETDGHTGTNMSKTWNKKHGEKIVGNGKKSQVGGFFI